MADLVVIEYDDEYKAHEVRLTLLKLQKEYLIDMADAVVAVKDANGKVKLHQAVNMTAHGAARGGRPGHNQCSRADSGGAGVHVVAGERLRAAAGLGQ